jgi:hypothetical protein
VRALKVDPLFVYLFRGKFGDLLTALWWNGEGPLLPANGSPSHRRLDTLPARLAWRR